MWKNRPIPKCFEPKHLRQFFQIVDNPKYMMAFLIAFFCGLRISEVCKLRKQDVNFEKKILQVLISKGGKSRIVTIPNLLIPILELWFEVIKEQEYLFNSRHHKSKHLEPKSMAKAFRGYLRKAGLAEIIEHNKVGIPKYRFSFHSFRHSYCTYLIENGTDPIIVQHQAGHSRLDTTMIYTHLSQGKQQKEINAAFEHKTPDIIARQLENNKKEMQEDPIQRLNMRFANGEINEEDYIKRKQLLLEQPAN